MDRLLYRTTSDPINFPSERKRAKRKEKGREPEKEQPLSGGFLSVGVKASVATIVRNGRGTEQK